MEQQFRLHLGDCVPVLQRMEDNSVDLIATDPPYEGLKGGITYSFPRLGEVKNMTTTVGERWKVSSTWLNEAWRICTYGMIVFCSYHNIADVRSQLSEAEIVGLITWYKRNSPPPIGNVPRFTTEFAWLFKKKPGLKWRNLETTMIDIPGLPGGCLAQERIQNRDGTTAHPTQKPVELMHLLLQIGGETVCDPFMGTGTTGVAAVKLGKQFIGMENNEVYFDHALRRITDASRAANGLNKILTGTPSDLAGLPLLEGLGQETGG